MSTSTVAGWFHDRVCRSDDCADPAHIGLWRTRARAALQCSTLDQLAVLAHDAICSVWHEGAHPHLSDRSVRACGEGGRRHADWMARTVDVAQLAELCGIDTHGPAGLFDIATGEAS